MAAVLLKRSDLPSLEGRSGPESMTFFAGEVRDAFRGFLGDIEAKHRAGASGLEITRACSAGVGVVVEHLYESLREWMGLKLQQAPALVALGGFGRRELSPGSDVDLLFLRGSKAEHETGVFSGYLVRMMWDAGLKLGHSVRTVAELRKALKGDLDLKTALLDGRWLLGDEGIKSKLVQMKAAVREKESGELLVAKLDETLRRWKKYGHSYHLIEPNVKESPGGLRDYHTIRWVGMVLPWEGTLQGLYRLSIIDREEINDIQDAFDFLIRVRNELHFVSQSDWNVLTLEMQRTIAAGLGYTDRGGLIAVEHFMRDYYSRTRSIYNTLERIIEETRGKGSLRIMDGALYKRVGTKGLGQLDLRLRRDKMENDPLFAFKELLRSGMRFSPNMEKRIKNVFKKEKLDSSYVRSMKASFLDLLQMPGKKAHVIRAMHELDALKHIFPPFENLRCLKRYDLYHQYTADEHSLQAVSHLEDLGEGKDGLLTRIYNEVAEKMELYLATLLHDIGKVDAHSHARVGAKMTDEILKDFPLSGESRSLISFLVKSHLLLSHFSQRRDMEDRDTSLQFIKKIKNHRALKLLYLLTYADLKATGAGIWTGWKKNLLEDLYFKASRLLAEKSELEISYSNILETRREKILEVCGEPARRKEMKAHLSGLPARYTMVVSPLQALSHLEMIEQLEGRLSLVRFKRLRHAKEITICTRDKPFRLSQLCGVITINDLNILGAYAFTRSDGIVIDLFHTEGIDGRFVLSASVKEKLVDGLDAVLGGRVNLEEAFKAHVKKWKRRAPKAIPVPCTVEFENELSRDFTIIDITAGDRPGLLYLITHIFSEEGLDIQSAQITTRGGVAADSFYVNTSEGGKLGDAAMMRALRKRLVAELGRGTAD